MSESVLVSPKEFWRLKVLQIVQKWQYGQINDDGLRHDLKRLGYDKEDLDKLLG